MGLMLQVGSSFNIFHFISNATLSPVGVCVVNTRTTGLPCMSES